MNFVLDGTIAKKKMIEKTWNVSYMQEHFLQVISSKTFL